MFRVSGNMSESKGDEALGEYKKALEVMSAKKLLLTGLPPLIRTTMCCSSGAVSARRSQLQLLPPPRKSLKLHDPLLRHLQLRRATWLPCSLT